MTPRHQTKKWATLEKFPRAEAEDGEEAAESSKTLSPSSDPDESSTPFTSFVTSFISRPRQSDVTTPTPDPTQSDPLSTNSMSTSSIKASIHPSPSPSLSHIWHPTRVGTVVAESEIPDAWAAKNLDKTKQMNELFIGCMSLVFVLTLAGIIGVGCWEAFWDSDFIPKKISNRAKRAAAKKERERERIRALEDAMELQKEVQRQEEIRLMEMAVKATGEKREKERETVRQVEVETETEIETGMETESEGRLSEVAPSEESTERLLAGAKYA
ncbi:hypothetical protein HBI49_064870 [Parastagonospora nodorum]|nr:hypothetical protein HBI49_064870 [Parastagonospora nodorum]